MLCSESQNPHTDDSNDSSVNSSNSSLNSDGQDSDSSSKLGGFKLNFYKKATFTPPSSSLQSVSKKLPLLSQKTSRRKVDGINKGVTHKIRKPKATKKKEIKKNKAKQSFYRMKEVKMAPRMPSNRSPLQPGVKGKRHLLSSPGMSLLDIPDSISESSIEPKMKFFTTRSRDPATIKINETIKLAAENGTIKIAHREGGFEKKNIGHTIELELEKRIAAASLDSPGNGLAKLEQIAKMSSLLQTPRPTPTRFPKSPSPSKNISHFLTSSGVATVLKRSAVKSPPKRKLLSAISSDVLDSPSKLRRSPRKKAEIAKSECAGNKTNRDSLVYSNKPKISSNSQSLLKSYKTLENGHCPNSAAEFISDEDTKGLKDLGLALEDIASSSPEEDEILYSLIKENISPEKIINSPDKPVSILAKNSMSDSSTKFCENTVRCSPRRCSPRKLMVSSPRVSTNFSAETIRSDPINAPTNAQKNENSKIENQNVKYFPIFIAGKKIKKLSVNGEEKLLNSLPQKKFILKKSDDSQRILDAGQKEFGATFCKACSFMYEIGDPEEESSHLKHHDQIMDALKLNGWKSEKQVTNIDYQGGRIIKISPTDPSYQWRKVKEILQCVDDDLGFSENGIKDQSRTYAYLYILGKLVIGCLIAEIIEKAYKVVQQNTSDNCDNGNLICCSDVAQSVCLGISRIWVLSSHRRKGIASQLVDTMRANFMIGHFLSLDQFAFSDPTQYGMNFAEKYCKKHDFLVYRRE